MKTESAELTTNAVTKRGCATQEVLACSLAADPTFSKSE
jgi:hypothetical protein